MSFCSTNTLAKKHYLRDARYIMASYAAVLVVVSWTMKRGHVHGAPAYIIAALPALLIVGLILRMGRYLSEETDEYQRMLTVRSILVGTAALLGTVVVEDFVRGFANAPALPPFVSFFVFMAATGFMQFLHWTQNRRGAE
jgi:hypothetical protein